MGDWAYRHIYLHCAGLNLFLSTLTPKVNVAAGNLSQLED